ncbi:hypothetical protein BV22DRAFT_1132440 [Leucogyrophana mollusca]|uniref:Uncharacterized protein n=1 Tax=Leucogyrophana mollusca TaxID=85980 RepID=A0ACB8B7U0_9AGAM|nr:hypothetical protein BV22DRAFT_1132440 [Leucogyrophana mollusca]
MLKRQRPASPPPTSFELSSLFPDRPIRPLPQREASEPGPSQQPRAKRRRVYAPVLDGTCRGWLPAGVSSSVFGTQESDGEEDWVDEGDDEFTSGQPNVSPEEMAMYKQTNSILHEVHTLHQHRLMSSNSSLHTGANSLPYPNWSPPSTISQQSSAQQAYSQHPPSHTRSPGYYVPASGYSGGKASFPVQPDRPVPYAHTHASVNQDHQQTSSWQPPPHQGSIFTEPEIDEVESVRERYGDSNKLLGSLFLLRRRALEGSLASSDALPDEFSSTNHTQ